MWLWMTVAHAGKWSAPVCLDAVPPEPAGAVRVAFDPSAPPTVLVPRGYARHGRVAPRGAYFDERGRVYGFSEVERALLAQPIAGPLHTAYREAAESAQLATSDIGLNVLGTLLDDPNTWTPGANGTWTAIPNAGWAERQEKRNENIRARLAELPVDRDARTSSFLRAVCLYNLTQAGIVEDDAARNARMAELLAVRRPEDPPMAAWAVTDQLYAAIGWPRPAPDVWRADVAAVWATLSAGEAADALRGRVVAGDGATLAARIAPPVPEPPAAGVAP